MCGIIGIFDREGRDVDLDCVLELRDAMRHRGPDDAGCWRRKPEGDVVLAHRRLSIVDLSRRGRQPMASEDGSVLVVFNGESYNHLQLRGELERRGHRFRSACDAEVLVHLYEEHGAAMVEHLRGMFAFAIWDARSDSLLVARDRLGIKPLYWVDDGHRFAFASETRALLPLLARREMDPSALAEYLTFGAVPPPSTLFAGIKKLAPASVMRVTRQSGPEPPQRYWDPIGDRVDLRLTPDEWEAQVRESLIEAIELRTMSDVPIGVFLSGGVDSSAVVATISELGHNPVNTFSIGYEGFDQSWNELSWANLIADHFGTSHRELKISAGQFLDAMPAVVRAQDEPSAGPVSVPLHLISKEARRSGVSVIQVGDGADELFAGYRHYQDFLRGEAGPVRALRRAAIRAAGGRLGDRRRRDGRAWWGTASGFTGESLELITTARLREHARPDSAGIIVSELAEAADRAGTCDELDRILYQDLRLRLPELVLMRLDRLTMAHGVEGRVPFLDHKLVELGMAIPSRVRVVDGEPKHVLKRAVAGLLPAEVVWRPKKPFAPPIWDWLRGPLGGRVEGQIRSSAINELGYLDTDGIREYCARHRSGEADLSFPIWYLFHLSAWYDHWIAGRELSWGGVESSA